MPADFLRLQEDPSSCQMRPWPLSRLYDQVIRSKASDKMGNDFPVWAGFISPQSEKSTVLSAPISYTMGPNHATRSSDGTVVSCRMHELHSNTSSITEKRPEKRSTCTRCCFHAAGCFGPAPVKLQKARLYGARLECRALHRAWTNLSSHP